MTDRSDTALDRDLAELPPELRWREWMRRVEAVLFASSRPVPRADLARIVGQGVAVELLIDDLNADLAERPYEVAAVAGPDGAVYITDDDADAIYRLAPPGS